MSRRRKTSTLESLLLLAGYLIAFILKIIIRIIIFLFDLVTFFTTKYKQKSGNNFFTMYFDKGNYGEFILYRKVIRIFGRESVFTNLYLENQNTETTEVDVLAVSCKGIYVMEIRIMLDTSMVLKKIKIGHRF